METSVILGLDLKKGYANETLKKTNFPYGKKFNYGFYRFIVGMLVSFYRFICTLYFGIKQTRQFFANAHEHRWPIYYLCVLENILTHLSFFLEQTH